MGIEYFMPGWDLGEVSFNSVFSVDVVITSHYNTWADSMPPAPAPSFRTTILGGATVLVMTDTREGNVNIGEFGMIDDRLLYKIIRASISSAMLPII